MKPVWVWKTNLYFNKYAIITIMLITFPHVEKKIKQPTMLRIFLIAAAYRYILQVYVPEHQVMSYLAELRMLF